MIAKLIAGSTLIILLVLINNAIWQKEQHLAQGEDIVLALAPVDPRSLMQGDYMALEFEVGDNIFDALQSQPSDEAWLNSTKTLDGFVIVEKDTRGIDRFVALYTGQALSSNQRKVAFRARAGRINFATNAFFFSEGQADTFAQARYGLFKRNSEGGILLAALLDESLTVIEPVHDN